MTGCLRCGECCRWLPLSIAGMNHEYLHYLRIRGLKEEQGFILIPNICQHLIEESRVVAFDEDKNETVDEPIYACDIYYDPDRPNVCQRYHGQSRIFTAKIYIPPGCGFRKDQ
jgi:hypothetical protein